MGSGAQAGPQRFVAGVDQVACPVVFIRAQEAAQWGRMGDVQLHSHVHGHNWTRHWGTEEVKNSCGTHGESASV